MNPDSLIFDMDGTLWDAVDTYAHCWTEVLKENGIDKVLTRADIQKYMGMEAKQIYREIFPDLSEEMIEKLYTDIIAKTDELLPTMGGVIYPDVHDCIKTLSTKYKLFMLSNCQKGSIRDFMNYTDTKDYFIDYIEYGSNFQPKNVNIRTLIDRYNLQAPIYVGDTDSDRKQADLAYIPFAFAAWGFGKTHFYSYKFNSMKELTKYFMNLKDGDNNNDSNHIESTSETKIEDKPFVIEENPITKEELEKLEESGKVEVVASIEELEKETNDSDYTLEEYNTDIIEVLEEESINHSDNIDTQNTDKSVIDSDSDNEDISDDTIPDSGKKILIKKSHSDSN